MRRVLVHLVVQPPAPPAGPAAAGRRVVDLAHLQQQQERGRREGELGRCADDRGEGATERPRTLEDMNILRSCQDAALEGSTPCAAAPVLLARFLPGGGSTGANTSSMASFSGALRLAFDGGACCCCCCCCCLLGCAAGAWCVPALPPLLPSLPALLPAHAYTHTSSRPVCLFGCWRRQQQSRGPRTGCTPLGGCAWLLRVLVIEHGHEAFTCKRERGTCQPQEHRARRRAKKVRASQSSPMA